MKDKHDKSEDKRDAADIVGRPVSSVQIADEHMAHGATYKRHRLRRWHRQQVKRRMGPVMIALCVFLGMVLVSCGTLTAIYLLYKNTFQASLNTFIRPVERGKDEPGMPQQSYNNIVGYSWNILLLGSDNDQKFAFPNVLTQVMMVVHIDTLKNTVHMVSIPRDSWVSVPEVGGMHKLDQAFLLGAQRDGNFEGGIRLARQTIERDYGITIDRYAWVGLDGFAKVIDTLGGVDIDISHPIVDDIYPDDANRDSNTNDPYGYKRLYLAPGPQHLTGEEVLEYVRSRHSDLLGDIGRTMRQQQVLDALKQKLNLTSVFNNTSALLKDLEGKFYTDLSQEELLSFAGYGRTVPAEAIQRLTLGPGQGEQDFGSLDSVYDPTLGAQQSVIIPHCEKILPVFNEIFGADNVRGCNVVGGL